MKPPPAFHQSQITDELKNLTTKGYDVYVKIYDKLALLATDDENPKMTELKAFLNRDQLKFRACVEIVQTTLTDPNSNFYDVNDALLWVKKSLAETIDTWGLKLNEITIHTQQQIQASTSKKQESHHIDSGQICTEELNDIEDMNEDESSVKNIEKPDSDACGSETISIEKSPSVADSVLQSKEEPMISDKSKENIDKKSILQIISQLIPSNTNHHCTISSPLPNNEYHNLPTGLFPLLVCDQDLSSIIAYTLISPDYLKEVDSISSGYISDSNNSPNLKRKSQDMNEDEKDLSNNEKEKKSKQSTYVTIQFNDPSSSTQFSCRIYFPKEFDNLRFNFLCPPKPELKSCRIDSDVVEKLETDHKSSDSVQNQRGSERVNQDIDSIRRAFVRSLNRSLKWNARGGKSGSNFSKTVDDRFVLKEMTKQDVSIFEQFAPNYFEYLNQCLNQNQSTLLAKILGVFRVTIKKKE